MHYRVHDLDNARRRLQQQLLRMGWTKYPCPFPVTDKVEQMTGYHSPHIHEVSFWFEDCLKKINPAGVYYALEERCSEMEDLSWRCIPDNPNNQNPLDVHNAFDMARKYLLDGLSWDCCNNSGGIIKIIDWEHPENNTFEFVQGWRGALNDGFAWDFILLVNAIPLCGIIIEPGDTCQAAHDLALYQLNNDFRFPVHCHSLVVSNGEKIMIGAPWMEIDNYQEIGTLKEALRPKDFLTNRIKTIPKF